jgi:hypothetical protein
MAPFYADPPHDQLDALEYSVERFHDPAALFPPDMGGDPDPLGQILGQLETSIEGTTTPPTKPEAPDLFAPTLPTPPSLAVGGPRSPDPPSFPESTSHIRTAIEPPLAARPFFAPDGLSRESYRPHPGSNTGSLGRTSVPTRWCPEQKDEVEESTCYDCPLWDDHGAGFEECHHDWLERQHQEDESEE